jgi:hypothetical protein
MQTGHGEGDTANAAANNSDVGVVFSIGSYRLL